MPRIERLIMVQHRSNRGIATIQSIVTGRDRGGSRLRHLDAKPRHRNTEQRAAGITHETAHVAIEIDRQIRQQKGRDCGHDYYADRQGSGVSATTGKKRQRNQRDHRKRTSQAVHSIEHVECIDSGDHADCCDDIGRRFRQRNGLSELVRREKAMYNVPRQNQRYGSGDLHGQTGPWRQVESIVDQTDGDEHRTRGEQGVLPPTSRGEGVILFPARCRAAYPARQQPEYPPCGVSCRPAGSISDLNSDCQGT